MVDVVATNKTSKKTLEQDKEFMSAKSDIIFKLLFGNELNKDLLIRFLTAVLKLPLNEYTDIQIIDPQTRRKYKDDKLSILDVKLKTATGKIINIEIQVQITSKMRKRILFYIAKMVSEQLKSAEDYDSIKKTVSIVITGERLIHEHEEYHDVFTVYSSKTNTEFTDVVEIHTLELPKLPKVSDGTELCDWLEFINADSEEELNMLAQKNAQMKVPVDRLLELNHDSDARALFEAREKQRRDNMSRERKARREGKQEGLIEGRLEGMYDVARKLIESNMAVENISGITGLTIKEIENCKL